MEDQTSTLLAMPGVGFLGIVVIGTIAGWIAEKITASDHGLLTNLLGRNRRLLCRRHTGQSCEPRVLWLAG